MIKLEDKITIEMTGRDAARLYAVLGRVNGPYSDLWADVKDLFEPVGKQDKYDKFFRTPKTREEMLNYNSYFKDWENLLFKSDAEIELEALEIKMNDLQKQIDRVKLTITK